MCMGCIQGAIHPGLRSQAGNHVQLLSATRQLDVLVARSFTVRHYYFNLEDDVRTIGTESWIRMHKLPRPLNVSAHSDGRGLVKSCVQRQGPEASTSLGREPFLSVYSAVSDVGNIAMA